MRARSFFWSTLAAAFREAGWHTAAVVSNWVLRRASGLSSGFDYYDDFSLWDTFRAQHPLLVLLQPERVLHLVHSLLAKADEGGFLPNFPGWNSYTAAMIGDHVFSIITDAYMKGIRDFDVEATYEGAVNLYAVVYTVPAADFDWLQTRIRGSLESFRARDVPRNPITAWAFGMGGLVILVLVLALAGLLTLAWRARR